MAVVVAVLLVVGLGVWGLGVARDGFGRASPSATPSGGAPAAAASSEPAVQTAPAGVGTADHGGSPPGASGAGGSAESAGPGEVGGPADAGDAGAVPTRMLGRWHGTVTQGVETYGVASGGTTFTVPPVRFDVTLDIHGGAVDATVGTSTSSEGCVADLVLRDTGIRQIQVQEVLTRSNALCTGVYRLQLTLNDDGTLAYAYDATLVYSAGLATLTRA
jgi:hypothetical protein